MPLQATSGAASYDAFGGNGVAVVPTYIEDVFSTFLYTGTGANQTITNNIDLSTNGGLVWIKIRSATGAHRLFDTARGATKYLSSNGTAGSATDATSLTAFNSTGFSLGNNDAGDDTVNGSTYTYASWTFRKQPKFFDIVTWTGDGANRTISHSLGSVPACILVKRTSSGNAAWAVYHRSLANTQYLVLNDTAAAVTDATWWNSTTPTSTVFSLGTDATVNESGKTYIAYIFAHDAGGFGLTGTDNVISCGGFTCDGSGNATVSLGYEPQWILTKRTSSATDWQIYDNMRGFTADNVAQKALRPNTNTAESDSFSYATNSTGFSLTGVGASNTFIYIAIRRGPMKVPTTGTSVFYSQAIAQADTIDSTNVPFPPDLVNTFSRNGTDRSSVYNLFQFIDRLRGLGTPINVFSTSGPALISSSTAAEGAGQSYVQLKADSRNITRSNGWNNAFYGNWINYFMQRAPSFFDEVCYNGVGSPFIATNNHNLTVAPEMMICKVRNLSDSWFVYHQALGASNSLTLNSTSASASSSNFGSTAPTSTQFTTAVGGSSQTLVAYLFATCAGVSKVGSYTGTGTTLQINCGFTAGARFVLIKRTDSTGDWYVWDTARGIVSGNDPYLLLNSTAAEVTNTDYIDTYSAGFEISSTAPAAINASAGTYIFLAIA